MKNKLKGKDYLTIMDYDKEEIEYILDVSKSLKQKQAMGIPHDYMRGKTYAMIFEKKSTRTRTSFQCGTAQLGIQSFFMQSEATQLGRGEPIRDTARVIDRYADGLFIRTFEQEIVEEYAKHMKNPVINALTNLTHPCQGLADLLTIREKKGGFEGLKVCYTGDVYNVCHSLMLGSTLFGMDITVAAPKGFDPDERIMKKCKENAKRTGSNIKIVRDLKKGVKDADVVYGNTWHSMGTADKEKRIEQFKGFTVTDNHMKMARDDAIFMHCMPAYRGEEMTNEVIEGEYSVIIDQAENRMHTEKAVVSLVTL